MLTDSSRLVQITVRISYLTNRAFRGMKERPGSNLILLVCIASSFLVLGSFLLITLNLRGAGQTLKGEAQIEVYLVDDITPLQLHLLLQEIKRSCEVEKVEYRSQREALDKLGEYFGTDLVQGLDSNPLPASLLLGLRSEYRAFEKVAEVASRIKEKEGVEDVEFGGIWLKRIDRALSIFLIADIIFGLFIAFATIMIVSNFMRVAVLSQAESIQIMSLMGASKGDISLPLLMRGALLGGAGAGLAMLFLWGGYVVFTEQVINIKFVPPTWVAGLVVWGVVLGAGGSLISVRKHLQTQ